MAQVNSDVGATEKWHVRYIPINSYRRGNKMFYKAQINDKVITIGELEFKILRWLDGPSLSMDELTETIAKIIGYREKVVNGILRLEAPNDIIKKAIKRLIKKGLIRLNNDGKLDLTDLGFAVMRNILIYIIFKPLHDLAR